MLPVEPVTELTEGAVEVPLVVLTEPNVVLRVAFEEAPDAAKPTTISLRSGIGLKFTTRIILFFETAKILSPLSCAALKLSSVLH